MFYAFGGSKTLVKYIFFIMILTWDIQKHWQAPKKNQKNKPLDAPNIDRHQKKQKKQKFQQLLRSGPIVPGIFSFFVFFGAGLVHLVVVFFFFGACAGLVTLTSQNIDRHQKNQKKQTTRCTKHRQAPKKTKKKNPATTQKWTHSSWNF